MHIWLAKLDGDNGKWSDAISSLVIAAQTETECRQYMSDLNDSGRLGRTSGGAPIEVYLDWEWTFLNLGNAYPNVEPGVLYYNVAWA